MSHPGPVTCPENGRGGIHTIVPLSMMVSGNKDSMAGPIPCDRIEPIPESRVSSDRPPFFILPLSLVLSIGALALDRLALVILGYRSPMASLFSKMACQVSELAGSVSLP